ncbi:MAG: hypothetical protein PHS14_00200 [Elusimicrobia bacterium]|nr:hypothetical protein [Elusimicrobiota bacterium]
MITRALDSTGDWTYGSGQQNYLRGEAAIEQNIVTTVQSWVGDCYYDLAFGVDWYNRLDVGQQNNLVQEIKQIIAGCYGVVGVLSISGQFTGATRVESISCEIATIFVPPDQPASLLIPTPLRGT